MPGPSTPTPSMPGSPTPTPSGLAPAPFVTPLATLQQRSRLVGLSEAMLKAGMSQATADLVVQQQAQTEAATVEAFFKVRTVGLAPSALATGYGGIPKWQRNNPRPRLGAGGRVGAGWAGLAASTARHFQFSPK